MQTSASNAVRSVEITQPQASWGAAAKPLWSLEEGTRYINHGGFGATPIEVAADQLRWLQQMERNPARYFVTELPALLRRVHRFTELPVAVGFGISLPGHVSVLGGLADAAVVGSALVAEIEKATSVDDAAAALRERVAKLKEAGRHGLSQREAPR